ncbi:MAG: response regulator [Candidatus Acididesulfobacter guangdongensis]|uniref:histidine kinase n=1 Tax=Acididesulfobacter guangdongensis TaxID=2597225 RepID=A0A519BFX6_ACIG2|nr:MAG: response regulator [Candidatus Acididesulfobacter guangdongensis]
MIKKANFMKEFMAKILIYGGGKAAKSVIELLHNDKNIEIAALVSRNMLKEGVQYANGLNIKCLNSIKEALDNNLDFNIIFNLTGEPFYRIPELKDIYDINFTLNTAYNQDYNNNGKKFNVEIIDSTSAKLIWDLLYDRHKAHMDKESIINQLRNQKDYFKNILDDSFDMIMVTDKNGKITEFNKGGETILGYSKKDIIGTQASDLYSNKIERDEILNRLRSEHFVQNYETVLKRKDGTLVNISLTISSISNNNKGEITGTIGISKDITEKKKYEKELMNLNENLEQKIIERTKQLELTNKELLKANELKSKFIANMSHELRTPLNAIIGYSDLMLDSSDVTDKHKKYINNILVSGKHLLQLINNILDIAKIEAGKFNLDYSIFSVKEVFDEVNTVLKSLFDQKMLSLSIIYNGNENYRLYGDRIKFKQVIYNLLSNAIKFSFENSAIKIVCNKNIPEIKQGIAQEEKYAEQKYSERGAKKSSLEYLQLDIINKGIGVPENKLKTIFDEFVQIDNSYSRKFEGTGLGLALSKKIVELHGGYINVQSVENEETIFTVIIPNAIDTESLLNTSEISKNIGMTSEDGSKIENCYDNSSDNKRNKSSDNSDEIEYNTAYTAGGGSVLNKRANINYTFRDDFGKKRKPVVLVVEDDLPTSELFTVNLIKSGYSVIHAYDGIEAVEKAREYKPFAILLDVMIPKKDGWEVLSDLKSDDITKSIPVVITSMIDNKDLGYALGATDYLVKPIDRETLIKTLSEFTLTTKRKKRQVNILLIDDEEITHEMIAKILEPAGFNLLHAYTGDEGLKLAIEYKPDLILLDLIMPDVNGFEVAENIKKHPVSSQIPIFIITSKDLTVEERMRLSNNIDRVIGKRIFSSEELTRSIRELELIYPHKAGLFDDVTGLLDHNYFNIRLAQEINRAKRYQIAFSVILIDVDNFKNYNDTVGSFHSDIALKKIADIFKKSLRGSDVVVRFGYDEFAIILNNTLKEPALYVANRFLSSIKEYPFYKEEELPSKLLTATFVVASYPEDGETPEEIISKIFNKLCELKSAGGNIVKEV